MKKKKTFNSIVVYQTKAGAIDLRGDFRGETIWASLNQIAGLFDTDKSGVSRHIRNIFESKELDQKRTVANFATVRNEGERSIERKIEYFNLDLILSVGYRVNSKKATVFRQWATKTLRQHITKGYTINPKVVKNNYAEFQKAIENIKQLLPAGSSIDHASVLELVSVFADTWLSLDAYDKDELVSSGATKKSVIVTAEQLTSGLSDFRDILIKKGEATEIFGQEKMAGNIAGIIGNVMQSFGGKSLYPTIEEKAAHLLYFMIKNHPFTDGNKRSGAYAFIWFLKKTGVLDTSKMTPPALTVITLFIAESDPKHKDKMVRLVLQLLKKGK